MENYMEIFEILPQPGLLWEYFEGAFRLKNLNKAFLQSFGREKEELKDCDIETFLEEIQVKRTCSGKIKKSVKDSFEGGKSVKLEPLKFDFSRKGEVLYWSITNIPIECEQEGPKQLVLTLVTNITSQIQREKEHLFVLEELDRSAERCRHLIDQNTDGLYSMDDKGNFLTVNEGLVNLAEVSEEELLKMSFLPFCAEHHKEMVWNYFQKALSGVKMIFQADFISAKGRKVTLDISLMPLKIQNKIKGVYGIAKDVTEKQKVKEKARQFEEKLLKSEKKFKALVQEGSDMIAILNMEGRYQFVSDSVINILGKSPGEYLGKIAFDFIHSEDRKWVYDKFLKLFDSRQILVSPFRVKNANNEWRWIESKATNLLDDPNVEGIVVNSKDITDSYLQKKEIEELYERYRLASLATEDLIYDWNLLNDEIIRNRAFEENYGFMHNETKTPGKLWLGRIHKKDRERVKTNFLSVIEDPEQRKWNEEYCFFKKDGKIAHVIDRGYILRDAEGKAIRIVGAVMDMTKEKESLRKIEKQNKLLKDIAWEQAHIIRAPLARLKALVDAQEDPTFEMWSEGELKDLIKSSADELDEIILKRIQKIEKINN
ncbi:PAS domain-containing protein [Christiangramia fulva]|nr:PAS domain-containing protein [Christiangramia fulva]